MKLLLSAILLSLIPVFSGQELNILIKMIPDQEKYFTETIIKGFEKQRGCKVNVHTFTDHWQLTEKLKPGQPPMDVVKVPMGMAHRLASKKLVHPLAKVIQAEKLNKIKKDYFLLKLAEVEGELYYIPRKFETRIMVYLKSKVVEAVENWSGMRPAIEAELKKALGVGLPDTYLLVDDPSDWSYLDVFVAGYYWAHTKYEGTAFGRVAHRGKDYSGTALGLMDRCFQMGAKRQDLSDVKSKYFTEVLKWESLYAGNKIYNAESWESGWDGRDIWKAFQEGKVFLSFLTQLDCYFLHGSEGAKGYVKNPADLDFALTPAAVPLNDKFDGSRRISTGGWLWGIGSQSKKAELAMELIRFITSNQNQIGETERFGMIPVRKDILGRSAPFKDDWKVRVFNTSSRQLRTNRSNYLPHVEGFEKLEKQYIAVWKKVVIASEKGYLGEDKVKKIQMK
ncbi:extracellular solute-binding protein [Fibrobacterota bacterium]